MRGKGSASAWVGPVAVVLAFVFSQGGCSLGMGFGVSIPVGRRRAAERKFYPRREDEFEEGIASWYGRKYHGKATASGEVFDMKAMTAAHRTLEFGTLVRVRSIDTNRSVVVRINDRGPHVAGRIIDLSYGAARKLGMVNEGTVPVALKVLKAPR